ncbi:hypothetical protein JCM10908_000925 [Rhodotorula pacifica]|uniref:uncharacterized protein n=1 Tax=Rhodotorula pacifica TaxID=1495444 RepID=UPI0031795F5C
MASTDRIEAAYHPFEGGSVPRPRKKPQKSSWLSPGRFCLALCILITVAITGAFAYGIYQVADQTWRLLNSPHIDKHANASLVALQPIPLQDGKVVRSFFGPKDAGGVDKFDLEAALWVRSEADPDYDQSDTPWELLQQATVLENVPIDSKPVHAVQHVRLPKELVRELATSPQADVTASYAMMPSRDRIDPSLDHHTWRTSRNASVFGVNKGLPPFTSEMRDPPKNVFRHFLANSGTMERLLLRPTDNPALLASSSGAANHTHIESLFPGRHIATRSRVTMVRDFPVYSFEAFNRTLGERTAFMRNHCPPGLVRDPACVREYTQVGHFENLIEFDDAIDGKPETAKRIGWRYGPFVWTRYGQPGPLDYQHITGDETEDVVYDWHITWSSISPGRHALLGKLLDSWASESMPHNRTQWELAMAQETSEAFHTIAGHTEPKAVRPLTRGALDILAGLMLGVQPILEWHFWVTRTIATGIPLSTELVLSTYLLFEEISKSVSYAAKVGLSFSLFVNLFFSALFLVPFFAQISLYLRLEWQWGGPLGWIPVGVTKRKATHSERNSERTDAKFDWKIRVALGVIAFVLSRYGPSLPPLIQASHSAYRPEEAVKSVPTSTLAAYNPFRSEHVKVALRLVSEVSQLHLLYRLGIFASTYRFTATLILLHSVLDLAPRFIWVWPTRPAVTIAEVLWVVGEVALCWAAWTFPGVKQEEEEEEE